MRTSLEMNENKNTTYQNRRFSKGSAKKKIYSCKSYIKKEKRSQTNNLTLHLKELEKEEKTKLKSSRRKEKIKVRAEIHKIENRKTTKRANKTKRWFFDKINKIDKHLTKWTKKKKKGESNFKIRNEMGITVNFIEINVIKGLQQHGWTWRVLY